jgi:hypothetical protein
VHTIEVLDVALPHFPHQLGKAFALLGSDEQVHMVGHENVGVDRAVLAPAQFLEEREIENSIGVANEARAAVVAALDDMDGIAWDAESGCARHVSSFLVEICP